MLKNKVENLETFKVEYSVTKNNTTVNKSVIIKSINDPNEVIRLARLDISTKERIFIQDVKVLSFKTI
ncbi:hypothetical protein COK01_26870 [Priestia megaterium]|jgi:hypothetical protein|uniref:hypothetical protein n=1 Tax=Priestia megaterium TaxID=1404 RepID=UPI000BF6A4C3|nr:hypothetical protein [Priestia megaterium]MCM3186039.1 hypothetical protein [Priestia megaterium]MCY9016562.1 hypothetical protein [Priestia megaterium]MDW4512159.1 hypothetical protein [Priestia megaterium]MDW4512223.1 hypothetical protein [Priestia megaterium]MDW4512255.1 hypothetical protein [Priestia megaterium]